MLNSQVHVLAERKIAHNVINCEFDEQWMVEASIARFYLAYHKHSVVFRQRKKIRAPSIDRLLHFKMDSIWAFCSSGQHVRVALQTSIGLVVLTRSVWVLHWKCQTNSELQRISIKLLLFFFLHTVIERAGAISLFFRHFFLQVRHQARDYCMPQ